METVGGRSVRVVKEPRIVSPLEKNITLEEENSSG